MILDCELLIKFSDYLDKFPQTKGVWNCGCCFHNNQWIFSCRNEISRYNQRYFKWEPEPYNWHPRAVPVLARFDINLNLQSVVDVIAVDGFTLSDVRIFPFKDELLYTGTYRTKVPDISGKYRVNQFLAKCVDKFLIFLPFDHALILPQKNWTPIVSGNNLFFENFQQSGQLRRYIFHYTHNLKLVHTEYTKYNLRGNCQVVELGDFFLGLYHFHWKRDYYHYFALIEKSFPFSLQRVSRAFKFSAGNNRIQFATGMEYFNNEVYISYGVQDSDNYFIKTSVAKIFNLFYV